MDHTIAGTAVGIGGQKMEVISMFHTVQNKMYHVEILPPKQDTEQLEADLESFSKKYNRVINSGYCACITDNAMGLLGFQGSEIIDVMGLDVNPEKVVIHLNTFHTKEDLHNILDTCKSRGIKYLLIISGDGSDRLPRLKPEDVNAMDVESVTSVELLKYIKDCCPDDFVLGVAFNPYEPPNHEFEKMQRKIDAGASFIITQPIVEKNDRVDELLKKYPHIPVIVDAWMNKKLQILSEAVGYKIPDDETFDPVVTLKKLHRDYPQCGFYLSLLSFKTQFDLLPGIWP
ncbi:MAG TPA: hypothetical protein DD727_05745 [Clostridiales bacterium]|nr:hypothetical protein [Clostridiales bacterium]